MKYAVQLFSVLFPDACANYRAWCNIRMLNIFISSPLFSSPRLPYLSSKAAMKTFHSLKVLVFPDKLRCHERGWHDWLGGRVSVPMCHCFLRRPVAVLWPVSASDNLWSWNSNCQACTCNTETLCLPPSAAQGCAQTCFASRRHSLAQAILLRPGMIPAVVFILMHSE